MLKSNAPHTISKTLMQSIPHVKAQCTACHMLKPNALYTTCLNMEYLYTWTRHSFSRCTRKGLCTKKGIFHILHVGCFYSTLETIQKVCSLGGGGGVTKSEHPL